jgi:Flp pilus assembly protein TadD
MEQALAHVPGHVDVLREASIEAIATGEAERAERFALLAIEAMPSNAGLYSNYALALLIARKGEGARVAAERACAIAPDDVISRRVLAKVDRVISGQEGWPEKIVWSKAE